MNTANVSIYLDRYHPLQDGKCSVSVRLTFNKKRKYYSIGVCLKSEDFDRIMAAKRRNESDKIIYNKIHSFENKALNIVDKLQVFTFNKFEDLFFSNRQAVDNVSSAFDRYVAQLKAE